MTQSRLEKAFVRHICTSRKRGILFQLTFEEWLKIWEDSGHLSERGRQRGQYCMARIGDKGPYSKGNVKIITNIENNKEKKFSVEGLEKLRQAVLNNPNSNCWKKGRIVREETRIKLRVARLGRHHKEDSKIKVSLSLLGNKRRLGTKVTEETKLKMRASHKELWKRRKELL